MGDKIFFRLSRDQWLKSCMPFINKGIELGNLFERNKALIINISFLLYLWLYDSNSKIFTFNKFYKKKVTLARCFRVKYWNEKRFVIQLKIRIFFLKANISCIFLQTCMLEHKASNFAFAGLRTMMNFMAYNFPK